MAYEGAIGTLPMKEQWKADDDSAYIGRPNTLRPRGRPKKNIVKSFLEGSSNKSRNVHKCSQCDLWGHHRNTCKNPLNQSSLVMSEVDLTRHCASQTSGRAKLLIRREEISTSDNP